MCKRTLLTVLALASVLLGGGRAEAKVRVVTTIQTFRSFVEEIGGDKVQVDALVGDAVDPHFLDPRPSYALVLNKADLLVFVGLELEKGWLPPLLEQARNPRIRAGQPGNLDVSQTGVVIVDRGGSTSRAGGDIHPFGNPHYWLPPANARRVARAITDRLKLLDAANAGYYEGRYAGFAQALDARIRAWTERTRKLAGVKVVTYHRSWTYLTQWLGLAEIGDIEPKPGVPPDPSHLAALVKQARAQGAKMVIVESFYPRTTAQRVADLAGMKLVVLPPDADSSRRSYFQLIDYIIEQLGKAS